MKIKSLLFGLIVGLVLMILLPYFMMTINDQVSLPIVNHIFLKIAGLILVGSGVFIFLVNTFAFKHFGRGTPVPIEPPKELVAEGLYKYVRNPMYLGYFGIVFGEFFIFGHLSLLIYAILFVILTHLYVVFVEEPGLKKRFGDDYGRYLKSVPRWLPEMS